MPLPITINYTFATQSGSIPLSQLDTNFTTVANGINGIGNGSNALTNVSVTGGTVTNISLSGLVSDLTVPDGGTGLSTITANAVMIGNGTGAVTVVSPGTSGNTLVSNGTNWISQAVTVGTGFGNWQIFTSNGTFTVPTGVTKVKATVVGGGGGGWSATTGGGGGGGGTAIKIISGLTPGANITVTVGAAGTAIPQVNGGNSSFGSYCSATGGTVPGGTQGGIGGIGINGDLNIRGGGGGGGGSVNASFSGAGGSSFLGGGGYGSINTNGSTGGQYGGGGGAYANGASGIVIVEY